MACKKSIPVPCIVMSLSDVAKFFKLFSTLQFIFCNLFSVTMVINKKICAFSGFQINPGHGWTFIYSNGKTVSYEGGKAIRYARLGRNQLNFRWTRAARKALKKDVKQMDSRKKKPKDWRRQ